LYEQEIEKNRRWNFSVNAADLISVNLARSFIFSTTVLSLYASYLTDSAVLIGLVPAVQQVGYLLPQLFFARRAEMLHRKKPFVVKISVMERLPYLFIALTVFLWPGSPRWFAYTMLVLNIGVATGCAGLATPAWKAMLGKVIHANRRGLLFSLGVGAGGLLGVAGAILTRHVLDTMTYPVSFGICFFLSFVAQAVSWIFLTLNREPAKKPEIQVPSLRDYFAELPAIIRTNRNFARYLISQFLVILGTMGVSFYIIYGRYSFRVTDGFAGSLTVVALITQSAGVPLLGWLSDRLGHKWLGEFTTVLGGAALILMLFLPGPGWLYPVFILMNLSLAGMRISRSCITMEFGGLDKLPTFTALSGTLLGVPTLLGPIIGGWVLDSFGFSTLFAVALVFSFAGLILLRMGVRDPRVHRPG
jgi:MFS family permease